MLSDAIFYDALPFSFIESERFQKFVQFIAPGFKLVTSHTTGETLLNAAYLKTKVRVDTKLQEQTSVTIGCDGSSDGSQDPITHIIAITNDCQPFLLREVPHLDEKHTAENITRLLDEDVAELKKVFAVLKPTKFLDRCQRAWSHLRQ